MSYYMKVLNDDFADIKEVRTTPAMEYNATRYAVDFMVTDDVVENSEIPKEDIIENLVTRFREKLSEHFHVEKTTPPGLRRFAITYARCFYCGNNIKNKQKVTLIVNTREQESEPLVQVKETISPSSFSVDKLTYQNHVVPFHRECFHEVAGDNYEYQFKPTS